MTAAKAKAEQPVKSEQPAKRQKFPDAKVTDQVREFILRRIAGFDSYVGAANALAADETITGADGKPVMLGTTSVSRIVHAEKARARIDEYRKEYLSNFDDTPLAYAKVRVAEYTRLYEDAKKQRTELDAIRAERGGVVVGIDNRILNNTQMQIQLLDALREETQPLNETLAREPSAQEALEYLHAVGFGQSDTRPVQRNP